jgi:hypothetical protein
MSSTRRAALPTIEARGALPELARRRRRKNSNQIYRKRGYARLYSREVLQADQGCDFDFLLSKPQRS